MLQGIHILNKIAQTDMPSWWWIPMVCILVVSAIVGIIYAIIKRKISEFYALIIIGLFIILLYFLILPTNVPTGEYTYQVTIDNTVNLKEFNSEYEIIKQEGEIYYIKEK